MWLPSPKQNSNNEDGEYTDRTANEFRNPPLSIGPVHKRQYELRKQEHRKSNQYSTSDFHGVLSIFHHTAGRVLF